MNPGSTADGRIVAINQNFELLLISDWFARETLAAQTFSATAIYKTRFPDAIREGIFVEEAELWGTMIVFNSSAHVVSL